MKQINTYDNQVQQSSAPMMTKIIDGRTYLVRVYFAPDGAETMEQKIMRMMRNEVQAKM